MLNTPDAHLPYGRTMTYVLPLQIGMLSPVVTFDYMYVRVCWSIHLSSIYINVILGIIT